MRICLFTPSFFPVIGGVEYFTDMLARGMIARGHEVVVIAQIMKSSTPLWPLPYPVRQYRRPPMQHLWAESWRGRWSGPGGNIILTLC
jgi:hypothetical protein